ncbi:cytosol aminopeptidase family, catalytic domain-containing protein [Paraphysoderma sedebokerense]|nr:cytosol aminopeptidase family, catalytic domain-containing protein [Paraphysoderma sedebokerense]
MINILCLICLIQAATGVKALKENGSTRIFVDLLSSPHSTAEGSFLSTYQYITFKNPKSVRLPPEILPFSPPANVSENSSSNSKNNYNWQTGKVYADSQNFARELMETPANHLTPRIFCDVVAKKFEELSLDSSMLKLTVRDEQWIQKNGLNAFGAVAKGSAEPPRLLEIEYNGTGVNNADKTVALVGKGVTFDSGGISIKPSAGMASMKGDMGGAATVVSTLYGIAKLKHPISVRGFIPLCENMPDGRATKPGDVVKALNGMSIEIDNTDAEGRLILADALYYARSTYNPHTIIDVATLTGAIDVALGPLYSGLFSTSSRLAEELVDAGNRMHDKFWRMPMDEEYRKLMKSVTADIKNVGNRSGGACTAAIFLKQFLTPAVEKGEYGKVTENNGASDKNEEELRYAHLDIAGTMESAASDGYHVKGMSGRPTRSLIDFLRHYKDIQV